MAVQYWDEVLEPIVRLYTATVGDTFVLMDDNARHHRTAIIDDYLGHAVFSRFPPSAILIELKTALQKNGDSLILWWLTT